METLMKNKRLFLSVSVLLAIIAVTIVISGCAFRENPEDYIHINVGGRHVGNENLDVLAMSYDKEGPFSPEVEEMIAQIRSWNNEAISEIIEKFEPPMDIEVYYRTGGDKTTIAYIGTATSVDNKELVNYKNEKVFDFILVSEECFKRDNGILEDEPFQFRYKEAGE